MCETPISVRNLGKRYLLGSGGRERYRALRDVIANSVKNLFNRKERQSDITEIWALKDVSFDIQKGQAVGIIGRNGAGKTTLLKIISEITDPTEGEVHLNGRVSSLLEVGTGFHPELTGRENIFMNAAILGMTRAEIKNKFDEIVAFAEVEEFLDTPLKRYSSGMAVRLAFSVAAHLEPEILLIDEVLAVGDAAFQKKSLGKMEDVSKEGRTILLVSHNMASIMNLCRRAILLDAGKIVMDGASADVVQHYIASSRSSNGEVIWPTPQMAPGNDIVRMHAVRIIQDGISGPTADVDISKEVHIQIYFWNLREGAMLYPALFLKDYMGTIIFASSNAKSVSLDEDYWSGRPYNIGLYRSTCCIPGNFLNEGRYSITAIVGRGISDTQILEDHVLSFDVHDTGEMRKEFYGGWDGVIRPRLAWQTDFLSSTLSTIKLNENLIISNNS
jgi:lipopolysaccharide transport system ATP-binding protein